MNRHLGHKIGIAAMALAMAMFMPTLSLGAANFGNFSLSSPAGSAVTMGDASGTLTFTVTNDAASSKAIKTLFFNIDTTLYDISASTQAPTSCASAWSVQSSQASCSFPGCVSFTSSGGIAPGSSCTFDIVVTGAGDTAIKAAAQDQTDSLTDVVASSNSGASQGTGEFTLTGSIPTWQRKSLAISLSASPASTKVGGQIVVTMTVVNRSNAIQSGIVGNPSPPTVAGTGSAVAVGSPVYGSSTYTTNPPIAVLKNDMDAAQNTVPVFSTAGFPPSGRILIDTELVDYTGLTANAFTGASRGVGGTAAAAHLKWANVYSQNTSSFTMAPGGTATIRWIFRATGTGYVNFTARAQNSTGTATSKSITSNRVVIGNFTALVAVSPLSVISGQAVTVTMTVTNNGSTTLTNIVPSLTPGGTATATKVSGPTPASIATLGAGKTSQFTWQYTITGTLGQTYNFAGSATATGPVTTNTSTSSTGSVVVYNVTVSPSSVASGATNSTFAWTVFNNAAIEVTQVRIDVSPIVNSVCGTNSWVYGSHADPANWTSVTSGAPVSSVTWTADTPTGTYGILTGQSKSFSITFTCVPNVSSDTTFNFPVIITDKNNNSVTISTDVLVTAYALTLEAFDDDCTTVLPRAVPPIWDEADGFSTYCFVATLKQGGVAVANKLLTFTTTAGVLSQASGFTDPSGKVQVLLTAPCSSADVSPTVTASYFPVTTASQTVTFTGIASPVLMYVSGSLVFNRTAPPPTGDRTVPVSIDTGDAGAFRLRVTNCGASNITIHPADTSLAIIGGSPDTFALNSLVDITIAPTASATLTFVSGTIASGPLQCYPLLTLDADYAGTPYAGPYAFDKSPAGDNITDSVTVSGGTECSAVYNLRIIDWREVY